MDIQLSRLSTQAFSLSEGVQPQFPSGWTLQVVCLRQANSGKYWQMVSTSLSEQTSLLQPEIIQALGLIFAIGNESVSRISSANSSLVAKSLVKATSKMCESSGVLKIMKTPGT